jgi:hypothetical protein
MSRDKGKERIIGLLRRAFFTSFFSRKLVFYRPKCNRGRITNLTHHQQEQINLLFSKRFDRKNCNNGGLIVPKSKREVRQDRRKPAV